MADNNSNKPDYYVSGVIEQKGKRDVFVRVGAAWKHQKGEGINIHIQALPLNFDGKLVLFPPKADGEAMEPGATEPDDIGNAY